MLQKKVKSLLSYFHLSSEIEDTFIAPLSIAMHFDDSQNNNEKNMIVLLLLEWGRT
jgi:hypothetical protein